MTATAPIEARCDHCTLTRPLFLYEPNHDFHLVPRLCEWCERETQPLLCTRCYSAEKQREENDPLAPGEENAAAFLVGLLRNNDRLIRQAEADRAMCDGIAAATEQHTPSDPPAA